MSARIIHGDVPGALAELADCSIDACVTDPPYHLTTGKKGGSGAASLNLDSPAGRARVTTGFMGKAWDGGDVAFRPETWREVLRVLKPGAHLVCFGGSRTYHRLACAVEDGGFEIRDQIMWLYGSGFPKSLDVGKAIDKAAGAAREVLGTQPDRWTNKGNVLNFSTDRPQSEVSITGQPATADAWAWDGWGTALKPAHEPIVLARKPLAGTVEKNVREHGTGALNIDSCRVVVDPSDANHRNPLANSSGEKSMFGIGGTGHLKSARWPANVIHDGSDEVLAAFAQFGDDKGAFAPVHERRADKTRSVYGAFKGDIDEGGSTFQGDMGTAARFFYCAKATRADRDDGMSGFDKQPLRWSSGDQSPGTFQSPNTDRSAHNHHPTVKPTELMRYLCALVTPPGGVVLDPFMGSGSTGRGALLGSFQFIGIEREAEYVEIARARIMAVGPLFAEVTE